jgi:hypothetical protein
MTTQPVEVETLPPFSNQSRCALCGRGYCIRVHFDRGCAEMREGEHFHRICDCGHRWIER